MPILLTALALTIVQPANVSDELRALSNADDGLRICIHNELTGMESVPADAAAEQAVANCDRQKRAYEAAVETWVSSSSFPPGADRDGSRASLLSALETMTARIATGIRERRAGARPVPAETPQR
jgi:hypothetical protein